MGIEKERLHEYSINKYIIDDLNELSPTKNKIIAEHKYLTIYLNRVDDLMSKLKLISNAGTSIKDKIITIEINKQQYLSLEQLNALYKAREIALEMGAQVKVKDGDYWELEEVMAPVSQLESIAEQLAMPQLMTMEKFVIWMKWKNFCGRILLSPTENIKPTSLIMILQEV